MASVTTRQRPLALVIAVGLLAGATVVPAGSAAGSADRYVAPWGSDAAGGSADAPWRTLAKGFTTVSAGQTLWLRGGTYDEDFAGSLHDGTASARVTIRGYPGERALIKGLIRFSDPDYWTIRELAFTWGGGTFDDHMVKVHGGTGWVMERLDIYGSQSRAGLLIARSSSAGAPHDYVLRDSVIRDSANASNLYLNPGLDATGGLIERNLLFNSPTENAKIGWGGTDVAAHRDEFGAADVVFRYNTLYNAAQPLTIAEPAERIEAYGNLLVQGTRGYLVRLDGVEGQLGSGIRVHDNLGFGASRWCEDFDASPSCAAVGTANVFPRDPLFDTTSASGFHPRDSLAAAYGRWASAPAVGGPVVGKPGTAIATQRTTTGAVPVTVRWSQGYGAARYDLQVSTNGGSWKTLAKESTSTSWTGALAAGNSYRMRARGYSSSGMLGPWSTGASFGVRRRHDGTAAARYSSGWRISYNSSFFGGRAHASGAAGARVSFTFTGRGVGLISSYGPNRGKIAIYMDGSYIRTLDLGRDNFRARRLVYSQLWSTSGTRTLTIRVVGTAGRPRVDIDGFVFIR